MRSTPSDLLGTALLKTVPSGSVMLSPSKEKAIARCAPSGMAWMSEKE